jgi:hypothetical protein
LRCQIPDAIMPRNRGGKAVSGTNQWAIHIVSTAGGVQFQPWVPNSNPGDPAYAQLGDIVTWGDDTGLAHQPWPTENNTATGGPAASNPPGSTFYYSDPMAANGSSRPQYVIPAQLPPVPPATQSTPVAAGTVFYYCCKNHPNSPGERGRIVIF